MVKFGYIQKVNTSHKILELESFWHNKLLTKNSLFRAIDNKPLDSTLVGIRCSIIKSVLPNFITTSSNAFPPHIETLSA